MKRSIMILMAAAVLFTCGIANATQIVVLNTTIQVYSQSTAGTDASDASMVQATNGIFNGGDHPYCGRRLYVEFADKEIMAAALAAAVAGKAVNFIYDDAAASKMITGHTVSYCKIFSIWY